MYGANGQRGAARTARTHQPGSSAGGSINGRKAELTSAYASLAAELTRKEIKSVGGYTLGRVIGEGAFGKVHIGIHRLTNTRVAIKQVPKSVPFTSDPSSPLSLLTREIHHHRRLRHPHILALYEIIATESSIYLITELCTGGELFDYLVEKGRLSTGETRRVFGQLVLGVAHLHQSGVVHRDLKLENILLDERVNVKIADLGFGREFEKGRWMETWVGTLGYCAPEVVAAKRYLGEEVDIWSLGVILFTLLTGSLPFDDDDEGIMKEKILKCEYDMPTWLDEDAADLIQGILQLDPLRRTSLKAMLAHPFFTRPPSQPMVDSSPHTLRHHRSHGSHGHHSHSHVESSTHDAFPPAIPEEGSPSLDQHGGALSSPPLAVHPDRGASSSSSEVYHSITSSDISDSSFFSASDSDLGPRSGATTPITSEDGSAVGRASSAVRDGKKKALDQTIGDSGSEGLRALLHRNESEATLRKTDSLSLRSLEATPRGSVLGRLATNAEEEDTDDERAGTNPINIAPPYQSYLGLSAPPLQRNVSASSTGSYGSQGGSPVPIHTRTPSRTKRHSVGSAVSERLFSLDEEAAPVRIDYLALLSTPSPTALSTPAEKLLLDSLTTLGFDTGQIIHSIMTDACDSSAAIWWMLKRKADAKERERADTEAVNDAIVDKAKRYTALEETFTVEPHAHVPEVTTQTSSDDDADDDHSPPRAGVTSTDSVYILHQNTSGSASAPLLDYFPLVDPSSPTRQKVVRSKSKDYLGASPTSSPNTTPPLHSPGLLVSPGRTSTDVDAPKTKRTRSTSVSLLARATSALGSTLAPKKSADAVRDDPKFDEGTTTPTLAARFGRKGSVPDEGSHSPPPSPRRSHAELEAPGTPARKLAPLQPQPSPSVSNSDSQDTFDTVTSSSSQRLPTMSNTPAKKGAKGNLFSNFKMWFGDDRRKRAKRGSSSHPSDSTVARTGSGSRRGSRSEGVRSEPMYVGSPLKRPVHSRRSSNGSIVPPSRRSSMNSIHRGRSRDSGALVTPIHHRRRSDSSRASTSDLEVSRPPSLRSTSGGIHTQHSKAGSVSSVGSYRVTPVQAKDVYRRPPTTTTVRRLHSGNRHSRNRSGGSSLTRHSSSSSIGDGADDIGEGQKSADPILEEDETGDEVYEDYRMSSEREKAFKKLSGDWSSRGPGAADMQLGHSTASRLSVDSYASSNGRSSPTIFSAHKTRHVFGAPSQPAPSSSLGRRSSHSTLRPVLRDVFAAKEVDGDWVDEVDDFGGYGGGLGQASTRASHRPDSVSSLASSSGSSLFSATPSSAASTMPSSLGGDRDSLDLASNSSIAMFESRYAGVQAAQTADAGSGWKMQAIRPSAFRSAAVIEEGEEEEDE